MSDCNTTEAVENKPEVASYKVTTCEKLDQLIAESLTEHFIDDGKIIGYFADSQGLCHLLALLRSSGYSYSIRDSDIRKKKGVSGKDGDAKEKMNSIFYHLKAMPINFFGLPFSVVKTTHYHCSFGCKYYKTRAEKNPSVSDSSMKRRRNVASKKMGCMARMTVKKIIVYQDYPLDDIRHWRKKKKLIENLRSDLSSNNGEVKHTVRYYTCISLKSRHNHPAMEPPITGNHVVLYQQTEKQSMVEDEPMNEAIDGSKMESFENSQEGDDQDEQFFNSLVKFPNTVTCSVSKSEEQAKESGHPHETGANELRTYHIETIQYPTAQDLQLLVKEKLKRLYSLCESTTNMSLLVKLVSNLEQADVELVHDIGYDPL